MSEPATQRMILCGGLQSGGTTIISYCFLQRADTNGVLDMTNSVIRTDFAEAREPILWIKMTVGAFRWLDVAELYRDLGFDPQPLLIVREPRAAFASLMGKDYGINGTTAEDPPLRMRFRRFLQDWQLFRREGWPILRYEDFVTDERGALTRTCAAIGLPWDEAMIQWPKGLTGVAYVGETNVTFARSVAAGSLPASKRSAAAAPRVHSFPPSELRWLEETFAEYNAAHGYEQSAGSNYPQIGPGEMPPPGFQDTSRKWFLDELQRLWDENTRLTEQLAAARINMEARS